MTTARSDVITVTLIYRNMINCENIVNVDAFGIRIKARLNMLNQIWLSSVSGQGGFCGASDCEDVADLTVEVVCGNGAAAGRRRRQTAASDATVTVMIPNVQ